MKSRQTNKRQSVPPRVDWLEKMRKAAPAVVKESTCMECGSTCYLVKDYWRCPDCDLAPISDS